MKKASPTPQRRTQYYPPHHGVFKPNSATKKLRLVFNGSSVSSTGKLLNDIMHGEANLYLGVSDVLTWQFKHAFATDLTKMYRQIKVH